MPLPIVTQVLKNTATHSVLFFNARDVETERTFMITGNDIFHETSGTGGAGVNLNAGRVAQHLTGYYEDTSRAEIQPPPRIDTEQPRKIKSIEVLHIMGRRETHLDAFRNIAFKFADGTNNEFTAFLYAGGNDAGNTNDFTVTRNPGQNRKFTFDPPLESPLTGSDWALLFEVAQVKKAAGAKSTVVADEFTVSGIIELVK